MLKHAQLSKCADTCWDMPGSLNTCRHTSWNIMCSWYLPTYEDTCPALDMSNTCKQTHTSPYKQIQINAQLLIKAKNLPINADRRSALSVCWYQPLYADTSTSPWCLQTQADTWHDQPKRMLICTKSWADADTCSHMQSPHWYMTGYVDNTTAQNARQPMQIRAQLSTRANSC
jgi:hypothetical protein